jgi:hypothetical protein
MVCKLGQTDREAFLTAGNFLDDWRLVMVPVVAGGSLRWISMELFRLPFGSPVLVSGSHVLTAIHVENVLLQRGGPPINNRKSAKISIDFQALLWRSSVLRSTRQA